MSGNCGFVIFLVIFALDFSLCNERHQFIKFYEDSTCESLIDDLRGPVSISLKLNEYIASTVYKRVNGLWKIEGDNNILHGFGDECNSFNVAKADLRFVRYGEGDLGGLAGITLFQSPSFSGIKAMFKRDVEEWDGFGHGVSNSVESCYFNGKVSWGLYSAENYTGTELCLRPFDSIVDNGFGMTFETPMAFRTCSFKIGCREEPEMTTTTTTMSTTTTGQTEATTEEDSTDTTEDEDTSPTEETETVTSSTTLLTSETTIKTTTGSSSSKMTTESPTTTTSGSTFTTPEISSISTTFSTSTEEPETTIKTTTGSSSTIMTTERPIMTTTSVSTSTTPENSSSSNCSNYSSCCILLLFSFCSMIYFI